MVNNPDWAFVKNVLAVAPKVAAMVNLFLKLPKKLIGLKRRRKTSWL